MEGISEGIKKQIRDDLSDKTKRRLERYSPIEVEMNIKEALMNIDKGSTERMDLLVRRMDMVKNKRKKIIGNIIALIVILGIFLVINFKIDMAHKRTLSFVPDGSQYCYGIDSLEREGDSLTLKGWFLELKKVRNNQQIVSDENAELVLALCPLDETKVSTGTENASFFNVSETKIDRPDINAYFECEYDYSKCGFVATVDLDDLKLETTDYRLVFKPDASKVGAILSNVYLTNEGIMYTDPTQSPELDVVGTDLEKIVREGVRLVSRPDYCCYVYQLNNKLYWIADEGYSFCEDGGTLIQYHLDTTQVNNLPKERLENDWFWSNIGDMFERNEITDQMNCGKYRVSVREIPNDYSVTSIITGYHNGDWVWMSKFKPIYSMLM